MNVINVNGVTINFESAVMMMDDEIRERLHGKMAPCAEQDFFTAYEKLHNEIFNEEWELSKVNPVW